MSERADKSITFDVRQIVRKHLRRVKRRRKSAYDLSDNDSLGQFVEREMGAIIFGTPLWQPFERILDCAREQQDLKLVIKGPRGGGKTLFAAAVVAVVWRFFGFDASALGGSMKQSERFQQHFSGFLDRSHSLRKWAGEPGFHLATKTRSVEGGMVEIYPASDTSVRGPHPAGPSGGGVLVLDEMALIKQKIVTAALGQLVNAKPAILIQLSTMGEEETGAFWEILEADDLKGNELFSYDGFDVVNGCPYDCKTTCPVPEHFAEDYYQPGVVTEKKVEDLLVHKAYCGGKAHESVGWNEVDRLKLLWDSMPRDAFEREIMGKSGSVKGKCFDPLLIGECASESIMLGDDFTQHHRRFLALEKAVGIDWGYGTMAAACFVVRVRRVLIVYRWLIFDHTRFSIIRKEIRGLCWEERIGEVRADSEDPSSNDEFEAEFQEDWDALPQPESQRPEIPIVEKVVFSVEKKIGFGEITRRLEKGLIKFPKEFGGVPVQNYDLAMRMLRAHKKKDGKPVKKDDHPSDALMCACRKFAPDEAFDGRGAIV